MPSTISSVVDQRWIKREAEASIQSVHSMLALSQPREKKERAKGNRKKTKEYIKK